MAEDGAPSISCQGCLLLKMSPLLLTCADCVETEEEQRYASRSSFAEA